MVLLPTHFQLPRLLEAVSTFEFKTNPYYEAADDEMHVWFNSYNVYSGLKLQEYLSHDYGLLCAWVYPETRTQGHLETCMALNLWLFAYDDLSDESGLKHSAAGVRLATDISMQVLRNPDGAVPKFRFARMLQDLFQKMRSTGSAHCCRRFVDACELYTQASVSQSAHRIDRNIPTVDEFVKLRRNSSGLKIVFAFIDYGMDLDIPDDVHNHPSMTSVIHAAIDIVAWNNDLCSFNNEQSHGDTQNIVYCALVENNLTLQDAMNFVANMVRTRVEEFGVLRAAAPSFEQPDVQRYLLGLEYWISGSMNWYYHSKRAYRFFSTYVALNLCLAIGYFKAEPGRDGAVVELYPRREEPAPLSVDHVEDFSASI
ncbi:isoprenoid synthase domain-containing protein [Mycena sp. CBHHK59/15]|nr:isoprenoid synthase domain-containing protein [Mycena sp. CBHHK59/15]